MPGHIVLPLRKPSLALIYMMVQLRASTIGGSVQRCMYPNTASDSAARFLKDLRAAASAKSHSASPHKWKGKSSRGTSIHPTEGY